MPTLRAGGTFTFSLPAVVCEPGTLNLGASKTFTFSVIVDPERRGVLTNKATATANEVDRTSSFAMLTTTVTSVVGLSLDKTVTPTGTVLVGSPLTYTLIVTNTGPSAAMDVELQDELPAGLVYARSALPGGGECSEEGGRVVCELGTLRPQSEVMVTLVVTSASTSSGVNTAYVRSQELDWVASNSVPVTGTDCVPISDVRLHRMPGGDVFTGNRVRFSVEVLELEASAPFTYTWALDGKRVEGYSRPMLDHILAAPGSHTVSVTVTNACSYDHDALSLSVRDPESGQPDLSGSYKSANLRYVQQGDHVTYTLFLRNRADTTATVTLEDSIPTYTTYISGSIWASGEPPARFEDGQIRWSGQVISGTPVIIRFAVAVGAASPDTLINNVAVLNDEFGNTVELAVYAIYAPGYSMSIQDGALYTRVPTVTLTLRWDKAAITRMYLSNDGGFATGTGWISVTSVYNGWALEQYGDMLMPRTVYGKFRDSYGRQYATVQDDIIYDPNPPRIEDVAFIHGVQDVHALNVGSGIVRVTASDDNSGAARVRVSHDAGFTAGQVSEWRQIMCGKVDIPWTLQATGEVYVQVMDWAGNDKTVNRAFALHFDVYLPLVLRNRD
jgi:uncharacterized repeat protein (TIGR01451 family)